jgi:hypothetical protein
MKTLLVAAFALMLLILAPDVSMAQDEVPPTGGSQSVESPLAPAAIPDGQVQAQATGVLTYVWYQSTPRIRLMSIDRGFCYLVGISGKFEGFGESVLVTFGAGSDRYWYLGGTSAQAGVAARARCVPYSAIVGGSFS